LRCGGSGTEELEVASEVCEVGGILTMCVWECRRSASDCVKASSAGSSRL
jgi:hypothetical protein